MSAARRKVPRIYLRGDQRREQLLAAAANLAARRGWNALGMVPLAEAAGVSRQLVYEHFENLDVLHLEVTRHLFQEGYRITTEAIESHPDDLPAALGTAVRLHFELPRASQLALRELAAGPAAPSPAVQRLRARMREQVTDLWTPAIQRHARVTKREARAGVWMMNLASWSLVDLIEDGTFSVDEAVDLYVKSVLGAIAALDVER